ncbi:MAG: alpha/beta hydrolase [Pseudomonadota bacterium]
MRKSFVLFAAAAWAGTASAAPVGERHLFAQEPSAVLRDADKRADLRVTVWYPAADGAEETRIDIGPPGEPLFKVGAVVMGAPFADDRRRPLIVVSHGFGGSARMMGWFGLAMARAGYVVVAVDHPGNNGMDRMTLEGASLHWRRAADLRTALARVIADPALGPHVDPGRVGVAGFSAGGYTALLAAGARAEPERMFAFCRANPGDGVCQPQKEFAVGVDDVAKALRTPALAAELQHAGDDYALPGVRAAFVMAPAIVQELTPDSLARMRTKVALVAGDADVTAPAATNAEVAARHARGAALTLLPGVGHYDFLSACTPAGVARVPLCSAKVPQEATHKVAVDAALALFGETLGAPKAARGARMIAEPTRQAAMPARSQRSGAWRSTSQSQRIEAAT